MSKFSVRGNANYCATVVKIANIIPLDGRDNIVGTLIFGNHVIVSKDTKVGDMGIYFPVETALSDIFLKENNLYRDSSLNKNQEAKGYFEKNRRIRCMKFGGHKSEGLFMPLSSVSVFTNDVPELGTDFDYIDEQLVCEKYIIKQNFPTQGNKESKQNKRLKRISKLIEKQFAFHKDTAMFGKNLHQFNLDDVISITYKMHGTSAIFSKVNCKKPLTRIERFLKRLGVNVVDTQYDNIYASRKVVKNQYLNPKNSAGFYDVDIWGLANEVIAPCLDNGMTVYAEIVGFQPTGKAIQSIKAGVYNYGCRFTKAEDYNGKTGIEMHDMGLFEIYVYRITSTNIDGVKHEWSAKQVQQWCKSRGLKAVPEMFYGYVQDYMENTNKPYDPENFRELWLECMMTDAGFYMEKECFMCKDPVPTEGVVIRKETLELEAYKLKCFRFRAAETKELDEGNENIEDNQ